MSGILFETQCTYCTVHCNATTAYMYASSVSTHPTNMVQQGL